MDLTVSPSCVVCIWVRDLLTGTKVSSHAIPSSFTPAAGVKWCPMVVDDLLVIEEFEPT